MMVYCRDRSRKLPRKKKRSFHASVITRELVAPFRAPDHREITSQLEKRCESGVWLEREELEANDMLDAMIYGERGA